VVGLSVGSLTPETEGGDFAAAGSGEDDPIEETGLLAEPGKDFGFHEMSEERECVRLKKNRNLASKHYEPPRRGLPLAKEQSAHDIALL
jgi:hypothetical protein